MRIKTAYYRAPIEDRKSDWCAIDADNYEGGCPIGWGATEAEAIQDLKDRIAERESTRT